MLPISDFSYSTRFFSYKQPMLSMVVEPSSIIHRSLVADCALNQILRHFLHISSLIFFLSFDGIRTYYYQLYCSYKSFSSFQQLKKFYFDSDHQWWQPPQGLILSKSAAKGLKTCSGIDIVKLSSLIPTQCIMRILPNCIVDSDR